VINVAGGADDNGFHSNMMIQGWVRTSVCLHEAGRR
jgi:hypothetical protein